MANYLQVTRRQQVLALLELGWTYRRIEAETGVRRETVSRYDRLRRPKAAKVSPGSGRPDEPATGEAGGDGGAKAAKVIAGSGLPECQLSPDSSPAVVGIGGQGFSPDRGPPVFARSGATPRPLLPPSTGPGTPAADSDSAEGAVAGRRRDVLDVREILRRLQLGQGDRAIARDLSLSRKTVTKYRQWAVAASLLTGPLPEPATLQALLAASLPLTPPPRSPFIAAPFRSRSWRCGGRGWSAKRSSSGCGRRPRSPAATARCGGSCARSSRRPRRPASGSRPRRARRPRWPHGVYTGGIWSWWCFVLAGGVPAT